MHADPPTSSIPLWERHYVKNVIAMLRHQVPAGKRILEIGCHGPWFLRALEPASAAAVCLQSAPDDMPELADTQFVRRLQDLDPKADPFDFVIICEGLAECHDVQAMLENLHPYLTSRSRIIVTEFSRLWQPVLTVFEFLGLIRRRTKGNWLNSDDIRNFMKLGGFRPIRRLFRMLLPVYIPLFSGLANRVFSQLPGLRHLTLYNVLIGRPIRRNPSRPNGLSVVIPARNEAGNIEAALQRLPDIDGEIEVVFVEGGSSDDTWKEIQRVQKAWADRFSIIVTQQDGVGKGDAVRKGFDLATKDVLTILDADLTMPPEELPKFYNALCRGDGEFINGCRLIYPLEKESMRFLNIIGNHTFSLIFSWLLNQRIKDTLCGTKLLRREDYEELAANRAYFGNFDPFGDFDLIFGAAKLNLELVDLPIHYKARKYGETNISRWRHGVLLLRMVLFAMWKLKFIK